MNKLWCLVAAGCMVVLFALSGCDSGSWGEGRVTYGMGGTQFNGHSYVVYRARECVAMLHDPDCTKCCEQERI